MGARLSCPYSTDHVHWVWRWQGLVIAGIGLLAWFVYAINGDTTAAWVVLAALYVFLIAIAWVLAAGQRVLSRWIIYVFVSGIGGAVPIVADQIESHFADEEFFVLAQALALSIFWLLVWGAFRLVWNEQQHEPQYGLRVNRRGLAISLVLGALVGAGMTVQAYQRSFYPFETPPYTGISAENPFVCGQVAPDPQAFDGKEIFRRLLARVAANPNKGAPEYGMLALATGENHWAQSFRESLVREAGQALFTGPANSVKSSQYDAALRAYYYPRVKAAFPGLFTPAENARVQQWFESINRRAQTIEWVDLAYAAAFSKLPEGPYENQEIGAGLLALLEAEGISAPDLSVMNRDYLNRNRRGWETRFRNTDDALVYQPEWINNAFFQFLYTNQIKPGNVRLSFEWLLLQSLPDGSRLRYNHPVAVSLASVAYLGAHLQNDPRYVWLSGRALAALESQGGYLFAQPGIESAVDLVGYSPTQGSCLIYGDSGLPNQVGPLAPDKIVFRDGWSAEDTYLLLNLRFTGWHRYKATNTVTLLYQSAPLVTEELDSESFAWLPEGRSLFRDKRIPREHLNGLLIERVGVGAILYQLTGVGSPWAQDPPYYARVERFETGADVDVSTIVLEGWRGWHHRRIVYFYHHGPVVVVDDAQGPAGNRGALIWHIAGEGQTQGQRIQLRGGEHPAEMMLLSVGNGEIQVEKSRQQVVYSAPENGRLGTVTLFLMGEWMGAEAGITQDSGQPALRIALKERRITVPLLLGAVFK